MKQFYMIITIITLIVFNIFSLFRFNKLKQQTEIEILEIKRKEEMKNDALETYKLSFIQNLLNDGKKLDSTSVAKDSLYNDILLKNNLHSKQNHKLIYRFSKMHCESCVKASLNVLKKKVELIGIDNVILLGNYDNNRIFFRTISEYNIEKIQVYNISSFNIPAEEIGFPYFFVLNNNLEISDVYIPNKITPTITNKYLKNISSKYFK